MIPTLPTIMTSGSYKLLTFGLLIGLVNLLILISSLFQLDEHSQEAPEVFQRRTVSNTSNVVNQYIPPGIRNFKTKIHIKPSTRILIIVASAPKNKRERMFIRETWGNPSFQSYLKAQVIFLFGKSAHKNKYAPLVKSESKVYGDVLTSDFLDTYRNLTLKTISMLYYIEKILDIVHEDTLVFKVDDDVVIDAFKLKSFLESIKVPWANEIACHVNSNSTVNRDSTSKWFVTYNEWPADKEFFPPYCDGPIYFFPAKVSSLLLNALHNNPIKYLFLEDVYVTGLLAQLGGVEKRHLNETIYSKTGNKVRILTHFGSSKNEEMKKTAWNYIWKTHLTQRTNGSSKLYCPAIGIYYISCFIIYILDIFKNATYNEKQYLY